MLGLALVGACAITEDHVHIRPLAPTEESSRLDCDAACSEFGSNVNFCTIATSIVRPYLACKMEVDFGSGTTDSYEVGIPVPAGFDPATRGNVDLKWCSFSACELALRGRMGRPRRATVASCRSIQPFASRFLVCSVRTKTDAAVAFQ